MRDCEGKTLNMEKFGEGGTGAPQVEMLTCFGKPVAHVTLRSATAAAAMHRLCEQQKPKAMILVSLLTFCSCGFCLWVRPRNHKNLTVAFAPPRKAPRRAAVAPRHSRTYDTSLDAGHSNVVAWKR